jgi:Ser/Thr protein kinase RdoA (MazF antagonist)
MGLAAYASVRPLAPHERELIPVFDRSTVALAGMNWLRWIFLEQRTFSDMRAVNARLETVAARLRTAISM